MRKRARTFFCSQPPPGLAVVAGMRGGEGGRHHGAAASMACREDTAAPSHLRPLHLRSARTGGQEPHDGRGRGTRSAWGTSRSNTRACTPITQGAMPHE